MFFSTETQGMSHYYKVIVHRAYCMDTEYTIYTLLLKKKELKIVEKIVSIGKISQFRSPTIFFKITILIC